MMKTTTPPRLRQLAHAIDKKPLPGHGDAGPVLMRQGTVQVDAWNKAAATISVLLADHDDPIDLPYVGWPPGDGEICWVQQIGKTMVVVGSQPRANWYGPWRAPWGCVAAAESTTDQSGITTVETLTGTQITWEAVSNRIYQYSWSCRFQNSNADVVNRVRVSDEANVTKQESIIRANDNATSQTFSKVARTETITAGTIIRKLRALADTGTLRFRGDLEETKFLVEDLGPATTGP